MKKKPEILPEMVELNINDIRANPHQPRQYFDKGKLQILTDSIKENGLNTPIQIAWEDFGDGKKATLNDGERRLRAMKHAGFKKLRYGKEYIICDNTDLEYKGLIANCMREDLQPVEKGRAFLKILKRRGITNIDIAINSVNRAKDWIDNNFLAKPSSRNYFIPEKTIEAVAKDMKMIGVSGTNAIDLLKITKLPKDIQVKIISAPPNSKIYKEKVKMNRFGNMQKRKGNDRGEMIPISFARELARLGNDKMIRFFLKTAINRGWTARKLTLMVNDYLGSNFSPEQYIEAYQRGNKQTVRLGKNQKDELVGLTSSIDNMSSTLTSWRTINLIAMAEAFKQKEFAISGKGLLVSATRLKQALEGILLTTVELAKVKEEEKEIIKLPFKVVLTTPPKQRSGYRFTIPKDIADKFEGEVGDTIELTINSIIKENCFVSKAE